MVNLSKNSLAFTGRILSFDPLREHEEMDTKWIYCAYIYGFGCLACQAIFFEELQKSSNGKKS